MIRVLLCDDELPILQQIAAKVKQLLPESQMTETTDATKLLRLLQEQVYDMLLLDIDMPVITGLDIAQHIKDFETKPLLIFVTSHDELVYDSLQFHPFGFVRKSYIDTELPYILEDCKKEISSHNKHYCFHTAEGEVKLLLEDILYFESEGNYLSVHTKESCYRYRDTMTSVQNTLETEGFLRIHRGFFVNQAAVEVLGADELKLTNGENLPIGRNYAEETKKNMMRYMLR